MLKIGLTGGIGSGKSTVAKYFAELGVKVIDADDIVHELLNSNQTVITQIAKHFGPNAITPQHQINRKYLRQLIFKQPKERQWLENLLHPLVYNMLAHRVKTLPTTIPYCILVIPLLLETGQRDFVDRVLVVDTPKEVQIKRIIARDQTSTADVQAIIDSQLERKQRLAQANDVINNDCNLVNLQKQVQTLHNKYLALVSKK